MGMWGNLYRVQSSRLKELLADPQQISEELYPDEGQANPGRCCTVEKTWEAIEFILRRLAEAGQIPPVSPLTRGAETGAEAGYGAVWYRTAKEVREIADVLCSLTKAQFERGYMAEMMAETYVYPPIWLQPEEEKNKEESKENYEEENFDYVWTWYEMMVKFYREAAAEGDAMLLYLA